MPKFNVPIYVTFTFFLLCLVFWLQLDTIEIQIASPSATTAVQSDAEIDRLLLENLLSKEEKHGEKQQPLETWNLNEDPVDENGGAGGEKHGEVAVDKSSDKEASVIDWKVEADFARRIKVPGSMRRRHQIM